VQRKRHLIGLSFAGVADVRVYSAVCRQAKVVVGGVVGHVAELPLPTREEVPVVHLRLHLLVGVPAVVDPCL